MALQSGQVLNNRYRIVRLLGQGGFGAVYRAWDVNLNRPCAVKENLDVSPEAQRQFTREATVLANLLHSNLPRVTDHFILPGQGQYLVMDFVEGEDLATTMKRQGTVPVSQAVTWINQVADALTYLHSRQPVVVHRDIKPANIRITPEGKAMLVDFGLVKLFNPSMRTTLGARAVTPGYAPPEQYGQGSTDARTDLYALAATLYNLITGREPMESVQRLAGGKMLPANTVNPQVPLALSQAIEQAMNLEPSQRFTSVSGFKAAVESAVGAASSAAHGGANEPAFLVRPTPDAYVRPAAAPPASPVQAAPAQVRRAPVSATQVVSGAPVQAAYPAQPLHPQAIPSQPAPPARRTGLWVVAILVVVLCVGGMAVLGALFASAAQYNTQQTGTAQGLQTQAAQQTAAQQASQTAAVYAQQTAQAQSTQQAVTAYVNELENTKVLVFGPQDGALAHHADDTLIESQDSEVNLTNFMVEARFYNPYDLAAGNWDYGFMLRHTDKNSEFRFAIRSDRAWVLMNTTGSPDGEVIASGELPDLNTDASASNKVRLIFQNNRGMFFLNGDLVAEFDLSSRLTSGDILLITGMYVGNELNGYATQYNGFTVWSIP